MKSIVSNLMCRISLIGISCAVCLHASATSYYYVGASNVWGSAECYASEAGGTGGAGMPGLNDRIVLSANQEVFIDDSTIGFFSTVKEVQIAGIGVRVHITLTNDANFDCLIGSLARAPHKNSFVVKEGPGTLCLAKTTPADYIISSQDYCGYNVGFDVREGMLDLGPKTGKNRHRFGELKIASNAIVRVTHDAITCPAGLSGFGELINSGNVGELRITGDADDRFVFAGKISGFSTLRPTGNLWLTGTNNTTASFSPFNYDGTSLSGVTGFMTWSGDATNPSSLGLGNWTGKDGSARLVYLGETEEKITRTLTSVNTINAPNVLDGGEYGGLVFAGEFVPDGDKGFQQRLELAGDHANVCILSNCIGKVGSGNATASFFVRKTGTGTWRLHEREGNEMSGVIQVDDGTLEFDTIYQLGRQSALGDATDLFEDVCAAPAALSPCSCAVYVGASEGEAVLSYVGAESPTVYGRPLGVCGEARFKAPNCKAVLWNGILGATAGETRIAFESAEGQCLRIANVSDGNGTAGKGVLSVAKDGPGELILSGDQSFGGDLIVNEGMVTVKDISGLQYSYYRLTLKENAAASPLPEYADFTVGRKEVTIQNNSRQVALNELGLYAEDGERQRNFTAMGNSVAELQSGQIALEDNDLLIDFGSDYDALRLMDNDHLQGHIFKARWKDVYRNPVYADPTSWIRIVLRMADEAAEVKSFDLNYVNKKDDDKSAFAQTVTAFSLEGSGDGCNWESLYVTNDISFNPAGGYAWLSDGSYTTERQAEKVSHAKFNLPASTVQETYNVLGNVRSVKVSQGAELVCEGNEKPFVSGLWIDAKKGLGKIAGVKLSAEGVLRIDNLERGKDYFFAADLAGVLDRENAADWKIIANDKISRGYSVNLTETGLALTRKGLVLVVR